MVSVLRPGQRHINIPGYGVQTSRRAVASAAPAWWAVAGKACVAAYQPKGAVDLATSYINLANPGTYNAAPGTAPTFAAATGWTFNGSSQYLTTGITPTDSFSMMIRVSGVTNDGTVIGEYVNNARFELSPRPGFGTVYGHGGAVVTGNSFSAGTLAVAGHQGYKNGVADGAAIAAWSGTAVTIYIGDRNGAASKYAGNVLAVAIYSGALTAGEIATLHAAMAAL